VPPARWEPHVHEGGETCGVRGVPAVQDVADRLRWVATHRQEAAEMGRAASAWVHLHRSVWSYGPGVLAVIEQHARQRRRLQPRRR
jgi:hypothetical protein